MIESLKTRFAIIFAVVALAVIWNVPNIHKFGENDWWFSKKTINLGLDIQGGLHLVMGVDVDEVINEKSIRLAKNLKTELVEKNINTGEVEHVIESGLNTIKVNLTNPDQEQKVTDYIDKYYPATLQIVNSDSSHVSLKYYDNVIQDYKKQTVDQSIEVIRTRIDDLGVNEPSIAAQGEDRILVQLPGIKDPEDAKKLINRAARLTFNMASFDMQPSEVAALIKEAEDKGGYALGKDDLTYNKYLKRLNEDLKDKLPKDTKIVFEKPEGAKTLEAAKIPHLVSLVNSFSGGELEDASVRPDEFGKPEVVFRFTVNGRRAFSTLTEESVKHAQEKGSSKGAVAIILDEVLKSNPSVEQKIDSPTARITLGGGRDYQNTMKEAQFIATALRTGALPAALEQLEERTVGPTLGADAIEKGATAGLIGGVLVLIFMLVYYRGLGVVADIALVLNILLMLALLTSMGATLTLPGVAGIVLTVGMAVDANVIIFERIKEEMRKGASIAASVKDGFGHAFSAIIDANITTAAVCVVLMYFGTGPVKGFAVTLICGIITSMFTAIFVSRAIIELLIRRGANKLVNI